MIYDFLYQFVFGLILVLAAHAEFVGGRYALAAIAFVAAVIVYLPTLHVSNRRKAVVFLSVMTLIIVAG